MKFLQQVLVFIELVVVEGCLLLEEVFDLCIGYLHVIALLLELCCLLFGVV